MTDGGLAQKYLLARPEDASLLHDGIEYAKQVQIDGLERIGHGLFSRIFRLGPLTHREPGPSGLGLGTFSSALQSRE